MKIDRVIWCNRGWLPVFYGFCPNKAAWEKEMKRLGVTNAPYPTTAGSVTHFDNKFRAECLIVTVAPHNRPALRVIGILAHEAAHVWQSICEAIGEREPSKEFEAYSIQAITQELIAAYEKTRGKLCHGRS